MQLSRPGSYLRAAIGLACAAAFWTTARPALADGEVVLSGAYYKERSTRVVQPMLDARLDVGGHGELSSHVLLDAITSASPASGAAGQAFDEQRYQFGSTYMHTLGIFRFGAGFRFSDEPDYRSVFALARGVAELAQRNTTLGITLARGFDDVSNAGARGGISQEITGELDTTLASVSLTQLLSPVLVANATYDFTYLNGFQENAYRQVVAGGSLEAERVPNERFRNAFFASLRGFIPATKTTLVGGYRLYVDDWGIVGHTPDIRVAQEVVPNLDVELRYRLHTQNEADFYRDIYDTADPDVEPSLTADPKLSDLSTHTVSGKLTLGLHHLGLTGTLGRSRGVALIQYYAQNTSFGDAVIAQFALAVPLRY